METTYAKALNDALRLEMRSDPNVIVLGEDIGVHGGIFTVTSGLSAEFGDRVIDTPIAEEGFVGMATGAAIAGLRPVVELMFMDFALVAADQLLNQAGKLRFMSGGNITVPLTIRTRQGASGGGGPQHSQSLEALFAHLPGFAVALPSTAADAKGLLTAAIRMDEPTIVIEHQSMYFTRGEVPEGEHVVEFGRAAVRRRGSDVTLISYSRSVDLALTAAESLAERGIDAEVIDLRTVVPLDIETLMESVNRTGAAVVVHEASRNAGVGAEIAARIQEDCWDSLRGPVKRVTGLDMPVPFAQTLEEAWLPSVSDIERAVHRLSSARDERVDA